MSKQYILLFLFLAAFQQTKSQVPDSLDIKIGQMLLIGFPKAEVDSSVLQEVRKGKVGSLIVFEKNIPPKNSFVALKKIISTYQKAAPIPLFVCIDQEGGRVNRLKTKYGFPRSITAEEMGRAKSFDTVRFYAEATAATLARLGINVNFAPVVDLASNPDNPIIARYGRAFSPNEDSVALLAREFILAHRKFNVLTSPKHFPGHGSSRDDTHLGIADVSQTWEERELKPYRSLIDSGFVDAIMTSHIVNKRLDPDGHPGTLSQDIVTGILREELQFDGVIFTDDMQMHAITKHYGLEDAIRLAIQAGVDIMTFSNNISGSDERTVDRVHSIIRGMVKSGAVSERRIDESFDRVMRLKEALASEEQMTRLRQELEETKRRLRNAEEVIREANQKLAAPPADTAETGKRRSRKKNKDL